MNEPLNDLGRAIQVRRAELGLKRKELAERAGLSYPYLSELENGTKAPSAKAQQQLADALGLPVSELMLRAESRVRAQVTADELPQPNRGTQEYGVAGRAAPASGDRELFDRVAELVAITVRAELNAWARADLPALIHAELARLSDVADR